MSTRVVFHILTILLSFLYVWPELNFQDVLAQGDHGRDLYTFEAVLKHQLPYKNFWWVYGPIMPYYYGLFYKIFGLHISSILIGRAVLLIACASFFYLSCAVIATPGLALLAALWFILGRQEFICTYNHIGGTLASLIVIYGLLSYLKLGALRYAWISLISCFFLLLIKINFGIVSLSIIICSIPIIDFIKKHPATNQKKHFFVSALFLIPLAVFFIYWYLLKDLPLYAIHQCLPYLGDDQPYHSSPKQALYAYLNGQWHSFITVKENTITGLIFMIAGLTTGYVLLTKKISKNDIKDIGLSLSLIVLFFILFFHEFLLSNVWYRSFWSYPFLILFQFLILAAAFKALHPILRFFTIIFFWKLIILGGIAHFDKIQSQKTPEHFLSMPRGQIYVGNEAQWVDTVNKTTDYLNRNLSQDQLFVALPYDCLYYYLTGKLSPTRQLIFFDHIKIPPEQEISVIKELEAHQVNYVLMSTRIVSMEMDLGFFGKTYCPLLAKYFGDNFTQIYQQGGDTSQPAGWADNHGVFILKRNEAYPNSSQ